MINGKYQKPVPGTQRAPGSPSRLWNSFPPKVRDGRGQQYDQSRMERRVWNRQAINDAFANI
eukprot:7613349-Alexandrium_andersonii.AAC.1